MTPPRGEVMIGIVVVDALVHLPEIEIVGLEAAQRFLELPHRDPRVASVRADLGHEEHAIAAIGDGAAHPDFALVLVVFPGVVHERDAGVDRGVDDLDALAEPRDPAEMVAAEPERGHARYADVTAERTKGGDGHRERSRLSG